MLWQIRYKWKSLGWNAGKAFCLSGWPCWQSAFDPPPFLVSPVWNIIVMASATAAIMTIWDLEDGSHVLRMAGAERTSLEHWWLCGATEQTWAVYLWHLSHSFSAACKLIPNQSRAQRSSTNLENQAWKWARTKAAQELRSENHIRKVMDDLITITWWFSFSREQLAE